MSKIQSIIKAKQDKGKGYKGKHMAQWTKVKVCA